MTKVEHARAAMVILRRVLKTGRADDLALIVETFCPPQPGREWENDTFIQAFYPHWRRPA